MIERIRAAIGRYVGEHFHGPDLLLVSAADARALYEDHYREWGPPVEICREGGPVQELGGPRVTYLAVDGALVVVVSGSPVPTLIGYPRMGHLPGVVAVG